MPINKWIGYVFCALMLVALMIQLGCQPLVGLADNGDFWRITKSFGLSSPDAPKDNGLTWNRYFNWDGSLIERKMFPTSELIPVAVALSISRIVSGGGRFDIALLGFVHSLLYILAFVAFAYATVDWPTSQKVLGYSVGVVMFADVGYVAYFNSLYTESASLVFLLLAVSTACVLLLRDMSKDSCSKLLAAYYAMIVLFTTAKAQNIPVGLALGAFGCYASCRLSELHKSPRIRRRGIGLTLGVVVACALFGVVSSLVPGMRTCSTYNMVFNEIIRNSPVPQADIRSLGLEDSFIKYQGTFAWSPSVTEEIRRKVSGKVSDVSILKFYLLRPGRFFDLTSRGAMSAFVMRPPHLGNYESEKVSLDGIDAVAVNAGIRESVNTGSSSNFSLPSRFMSQSFSYWSAAKQRYLPKNTWFLGLLLMINVATILVKRVAADHDPRQRMATALHASLVVGAVLQFFLVLVGEGERDIVKHLFLFNLLSDLCFLFVVGYIGYVLKLWYYLRHKSSGRGAEQLPASGSFTAS